ncbi:MAG: regulatory iron-sulfur-containing complex subunit RicT [Lentimicrobiaceae bacterium]|nr:regulatory iron-sulfur-containing complex subunit RicT [Lentimicrobiaceae bacterium]
MEESQKIDPRQNHFATRSCCRQPSLIHKNDNIFSHSCGKFDAYDWLDQIPLPASRQPFDCVEVRFKNNRKEFFRTNSDTQVHVGDIVAVEANPGHDIGIVTLVGEIVRLQMKRKKVDPAKDDVRKLYRKARLSDIEKWITAVEKEDATMFKTRSIASGLNLKMKINDVEYQGDDTKAIFYYTADERVDFRELIKILADEFKIRIEMRQIGARQEASRLGGIGTCGRELCCSTWLGNFSTVSTNAARIQQLSLNPQKLAGQCGKLKCCLNYEFSAYYEALKDFPSDDTVLQTKKGDAFIHKIDVFAATIWFAYKSDPNALMPIPLNKVKEVMAANKKGKMVPKLEDYVNNQHKKTEHENSMSQDDLTRFDKKK